MKNATHVLAILPAALFAGVSFFYSTSLLVLVVTTYRHQATTDTLHLLWLGPAYALSGGICLYCALKVKISRFAFSVCALISAGLLGYAVYLLHTYALHPEPLTMQTPRNFVALALAVVGTSGVCASAMLLARSSREQK